MRRTRLPSKRMIAILNALFEAQAAEIRAHGGEIGDGLLAIFPIAAPGEVVAVAKAALAAARNAMSRSPTLQITRRWTESRHWTSL